MVSQATVVLHFIPTQTVLFVVQVQSVIFLEMFPI